jgi:hypothetical protein
MSTRLAPATGLNATPTILPAPEYTDKNEESSIEIEIPGRSVHPGKLTAMLRSNFGFGAYDIMVRTPNL